MTDFPSPGALPLFVHSWSTGSKGFTPAAPQAVTWVANQAVYMPFSIPWAYPVKRVFWCNGTTVTTSNADFGIYSSSGARIYSTGSTALSGTSVPQYVTPSTPFVLPAGSYYFAYVCDNTTSRAFGNVLTTAANGALMGFLSQASALPLPATATFATFASPGFELCGITRTASGF